jgi:hypothetical protein
MYDTESLAILPRARFVLYQLRPAYFGACASMSSS